MHYFILFSISLVIYDFTFVSIIPRPPFSGSHLLLYIRLLRGALLSFCLQTEHGSTTMPTLLQSAVPSPATLALQPSPSLAPLPPASTAPGLPRSPTGEGMAQHVRSVGTNTREVCTATQPECLGPCEPGTTVSLEGIVWHETDGGKEC